MNPEVCGPNHYKYSKDIYAEEIRSTPENTRTITEINQNIALLSNFLFRNDASSIGDARFESRLLAMHQTGIFNAFWKLFKLVIVLVSCT